MHKSMMELPGSPYFSADTDMERMENVSDMTPEQRRKLKTECKLAEAEDVHSQLIDRISGNHFQG